MQKSFFVEGAGTCVDAMRAILPRVKMLIEVLRRQGCRIIFTRETYQPDLSDVHAYRRSLGYVARPTSLGRFCIADEAGQEIVDVVAPLPGDTVIDKASFGAFYNTELDRMLRREKIEHLILSGVTTQCCVHSTLREAVDRGYWCLTIADCCAASEPGMHEAALSLIAGEGHLFGWIADIEDVDQGTVSAR